MPTEKCNYFNRKLKLPIDGAVQLEKGVPLLRGCQTVPEQLVAFTEVEKVAEKQGAFAHFFLDDWRFDGINGVWENTEKHMNRLVTLPGVLSPDYSLYIDMPEPMLRWNVYRSRMVGWIFENWGLQVIPTVAWAKQDSFAFCFDGLPHNSLLAISTLGVMRDENARRLFEDSFTEMCTLIPIFRDKLSRKVCRGLKTKGEMHGVG